MAASLPEPLRIDRDLRRKEAAAQACDHQLFNREYLEPGSISRALTLAEQVGQAELDRETNLNTRGAAVATVAGLIVTVSGAVAKSVFAPNDEWTDWTKIAALVLFIAAVFAVTASMCMAVLSVLRPKRGATTKNFLGDTLTGLWIHGHDELLNADADRVNLLCLDRAMRTVPEWRIRNRSKSRWLRRAWLFLLFGVILISLAAVVLLLHLLDIPARGGSDGPANDIEAWMIAAFLALLPVLTWVSIRLDWPLFARRADKSNEADEIEETREIAAWLPARVRDVGMDHVVASCQCASDCSTVFDGTEADVVRDIAAHAVRAHGQHDGPELRARARAGLRAP